MKKKVKNKDKKINKKVNDIQKIRCIKCNEYCTNMLYTAKDVGVCISCSAINCGIVQEWYDYIHTNNKHE